MKNPLKEGQLYCQVVFPIPVKHAYTYAIPSHLAKEVQPGVRVLVPF
ncbi:hypothetical protein JW992_15050, partial [candidate division KSB1 bacterium]|nr:hypothetical protein [candidate division KSB1 bacterium]